jgi:hypothetical protein
MSFGDRWAAAGSQDGDVPDGNYDVEVIDASGFNRQSDGAEFAKLVLQVARGSHQGACFDHFMNLNHQVGLAIARDSLSVYGMEMDVANWEAFKAAIQKLIGVQANVSLAHNRNGYAEIKVNTSQLPLTEQRSAAPPPQATPTAPAQVAAGGDDDIPF